MNKRKTWQATESLIFCHQYTDGVISQTNEDITVSKSLSQDPETGELFVSQRKRAYMQIYAPYTTDTVRIKSAILTVGALTNGEKLGVYGADPLMQTNPEELTTIIDYDTGSYDEQSGEIKYNFDITSLYWKQSREEETVYLAIKLADEDAADSEQSVTVYSGTPIVTITYESGEYYTDTHTIANFGQANVDLLSGKMVIETEDLSWGGNRMPFSLKRYYRAMNPVGNGYGNYGCMNVGQNWWLNLFQNISENVSGYTYVDETQHSYDLILSDGKYICDDDESMTYDPETRTLTRGDDKCVFNENGYLVSITDEYDNTMTVNYNENEQISSVIDGAGRVFTFCFNEFDCLEAVIAPDNSRVTYSIPDNTRLEQITYPDGTKAVFAYDEVLIKDKDNTPVYSFYYDVDEYDCVTSVREYGMSNGSLVLSKKTEYEYGFGSGHTVVTTTEDGNVTKTVYCFDSDGELVNQYSYTEKDGSIIPADSVSGSISNILYNQSFEQNGYWKSTEDDSTESVQLDSAVKYCRNKSLYFNEDTQSGVYQTVGSLSSDEYTLSAFVKTRDARGVYLEVTTPDNTLIARSETLKGCDGFVRLELPFILESTSEVIVKIMPDGEGCAWVDAVQLETGSAAGEYNYIANNSFEQGVAQWNCENAYVTTGEKFNMTSSVCLSSNLTECASISQTVAVNTPQNTRETYTFSAWAKGNALTDREREGCEAPVFRLKAQIIYKDLTTEDHFTDYIPGISEWQYASVEFAKEQYMPVKDITVSCEYAYNAEQCYFDDVCLVRTSVETDLDSSYYDVYTEDDTETTDNEVIETDSAPEFSELVDDYGNPITETTFTDGEFGTLYRSYGYSENGNDLVKETDGRGNVTTYEVDSVTSRITETTDRLGNKTAYEYDSSGKTTKVTSKDTDGTELATVEYTYGALDNMTGIVRGDGLKYSLSYNGFGNLESIGIDGMENPLTAYTYNNGSGNVKEMTYANGDKMTATYNSNGQMIAEKWYDKDENLVAYYKYMYDAAGNIVRSVDILSKKEYSYTYTDGNITRSSEYDIELNENNIVTSKTIVSSVLYLYSDGKLVKKRIIDAGSEKVIYFENNDDTTVVKFTAGDNVVTSHSKNDSFGRKVFDELQTGKGFVSRQFDYHTGKATDEHKDNDKLKSTPTTQLVREIIFSDGRTIEYEYDAEERITKVTDSVDGVTEYTYDALGQLLTETRNGTVVNRMVYDSYGNIIQKNGKNYVYDDVWKDKLAYYNANAIEYDAQGNPTSYLGHTLAWEKGRQLKTFDDISFTYNANGIRTSKTVEGTTHTYTLDGTKILREEWENNVLETIFDNEDDVCGIIYNNVPYYFVKNLQGDIIAITNSTGDIVVRYSYDAWGKCTIEQDYSLNGSIATVNPYRYRGYYYDKETELYYLQSRYYDAEVGRFVNADNAELAKIPQKIITHNIYAYCCNDPVNEVDVAGQLTAQLIARIIIGIMIGLFLQLVLDLISYWFYKISNNLKSFSVSPGDYVSSAISWALTCVTFNSTVVELLVTLIPIAIKHIYRAFTKNFDWLDLMIDFIYYFASFLIGKALSWANKNKLRKIKAKLGTGNRARNKIRISKKRINMKFSIWGLRANFGLNISSTFTSIIYNAIMSKVSA